MYLNIFLIFCLSLVFSNPADAKNCDYLQTNPPSSIVELVTNCTLKHQLGDEIFYKLAGCLLREHEIIDKNKKFHYTRMIKILPREILERKDLKDFWQTLRDCVEDSYALKFKTSANVAKFIKECSDRGDNMIVD